MVVAGDVLDEEGAALTAELNESALYVHLDVTDPGDWERAVGSTVERFGRLDVLINNAGILNYGPLEDFDIAEWHRIIEINLTGVFLGMRAVIKAMDATSGGFDHQYLVYRRSQWQPWCRRVCGIEMGSARFDQVRGTGVGVAEYSGEFGAPRFDPYPNDRWLSRRCVQHPHAAGR